MLLPDCGMTASLIRAKRAVLSLSLAAAAQGPIEHKLRFSLLGQNSWQREKTNDNEQTINIRRLPIANRGEIACRIIDTAQKMGLHTIAVYSEADRKALHVRLADEAIFIGAADAASSYLNQDALLQAMRDSRQMLYIQAMDFYQKIRILLMQCAEQDLSLSATRKGDPGNGTER